MNNSLKKRAVFTVLCSILLAMSSLLLAQNVGSAEVGDSGEFNPVFGPKAFVVDDSGFGEWRNKFPVPGEPDSGPIEGRLVIINGGKGEGPGPEPNDGLTQPSIRVTSGTIYLNGRSVAHVTDADDIVHRPVPLRPGENRLLVRLEGPANSSIVLAIMAKIDPLPPITVGSLELPYGSVEPPLALEFCLKNKSPAYSRVVRLACISPNGLFSEISPMVEIPPNGSRKIRIPQTELTSPPASNLEVDNEPWVEGSVNVIWVGRGRAPVVGYAVSGFESPDTPHLLNRVVLPLIPSPPKSDRPEEEPPK